LTFSTSAVLSAILIGVKIREVIETLESEGWRLVRTKGSQRQFRHPSKPGTVTVAGKLSVEVPVGTLGSIWKQAGLKKD
jgi:predicted RNA binding protein YcfA (HicA-like mRNA interferase family)